MPKAAKDFDPRQSLSSIKNWDDLPLFLTVDQVAELTGTGTAHWYNLARTKDFPARKLTRTIIISRDGLRAWAEGEERWKQGISLWQWQKVLQQLQELQKMMDTFSNGFIPLQPIQRLRKEG